VDAEDRFTELYRRHHAAVWAYALRRLPAGADPADAALKHLPSAASAAPGM